VAAEPFALRLRAARRTRRLTQEQVATLVAQITPLTRSHYSNIESGRYRPNRQVLHALARVLDLELDPADEAGTPEDRDLGAVWSAAPGLASDVVSGVVNGDGAFFVPPTIVSDGLPSRLHRGTDVGPLICRALDELKQQGPGPGDDPDILLAGAFRSERQGGAVAGLPLTVRTALASALENGLRVVCVVPTGAAGSDEAATLHAIAPLVACPNFFGYQSTVKTEPMIVFGGRRTLRVYGTIGGDGLAVECDDRALVLEDRTRLLALLASSAHGGPASEISVRRFVWDDECGAAIAERATYQALLAQSAAGAVSRDARSPIRVLSGPPPLLLMSRETFTSYVDARQGCAATSGTPDELDRFQEAFRVRRESLEALLEREVPARIVVSLAALRDYTSMGSSVLFGHLGCEVPHHRRMEIARDHLQDVLRLLETYPTLSIALTQTAEFGSTLAFEAFGEVRDQGTVAVTCRYHHVEVAGHASSRPVGLIVGSQLFGPFATYFDEVWRFAETDRNAVTTLLQGFLARAGALVG
jgi:transcriptional regulator with XRE-family HTH domain